MKYTRRTSIAVVSITLTSIWLGCADEAPSLAVSQGCSLSSECKSPLVCAFARCHQACKSTRDCSNGERCVQSDKPYYVCQKQGCTRSSECLGKQVCGVDGQCRDRCITQKDCLEDQVCVSGTCADTSELLNGTLPTATTDAGSGQPCTLPTDCPGDLVCLRGGVCGPECIGDKDCLKTFTCTPLRPGGPGRCTPADGGTAPIVDASIDECASNPCLNGGVCIDGASSFTCKCAPGFSGPTCSVNDDDCAPNPCKNGGVCTDGIDAFSCKCAAGFSGPTCAVNDDDCAPNPCKNGGSCKDGVNAFTCSCVNGFSGPTCDVPPYPTSNMMAYWNFEQPNGTVKDQSTNGNDAVTVTATRGNGRLGFGYDFAGAQCIGFANTPSLNLQNKPGLTAMMWEKHAFSGNINYFMGISDRWQVIYRDTALQAALPRDLGWFNSGTFVLASDTWEHIAVTWDGAALLHYVNGVQVYQRAQGGAFNDAGGAGFGLGCGSVSFNGQTVNGTVVPLTGSIDEVFVYDRALSAVEISSYYNATKP